MSHEDKLLELELARFEMEKKRDKHASIRFILGTVLLALGSTGLTIYLDEQREKRALAASERQWVVPMVIETHNYDHGLRIKRLQSLVELQLTPQTTNYLKGEIEAAQEEVRVITASNEALEKAKQEAEALAKAADEAKEGVAVLAMNSARLNPEMPRPVRPPAAMAPAPVPMAPTPVPMAPAPVVIAPEPMSAEEVEKQSKLAQEKSLQAEEAAKKAREIFEKLTVETEQLTEELNQKRLMRLKSF